MRKQRSTKNGKCQKQVENEAGELQARIPFKRRGIHNYVGLYCITDPGILYIIIYGFPMVFLWLSYGFPMVFLWFSYGFPNGFPSFS